ncbi:hypothetical protein BDP55DRAFT_750593 [Colletotrichum godetiae]|uniref:Uncharacterized protein n=1 Tax=Colletotrichum godetiae TaxID=1209918 RepID=A0AAJ0AEM2_9PEZI|nr:uncharacterized protein BDP55DRAFT_750593 [Colletotrichum godetiae]KAK1672483.1 hypothetical protein BDP55DRAFT_750593 [Colletotrichum godetiae]
MVNDPFGLSWHEDSVRKMIEDRLLNLKSYQILLEKVGEIKLAIEDISKSIDLPLNDEHIPSNSVPLATALKYVMFVIGKSTYTGSMVIIEDNITDIESLVDRSIEMVPEEHHERSCSHEIYLQVMPQALGKIARRSDEILREIEVTMSMNFGIADQAAGFHQGSMWEEIVIRYHQLKMAQGSVVTDRPAGNDFLQAALDSDIVTSRDILFLRKDSLLRYSDTFVMATLPEMDGRLVEQMTPSLGCRNEALVSLGILLARSSVAEEPWSRSAMTTKKAMLGDSRLMCDRLTAYRVLRHELGSSSYANAVRCCIEKEFNREHLDLTDQDFRQEVYERVVRPMEDEKYGYV